MSLARAFVLATIALALSGCQKNERPIGYTPEEDREPESSVRQTGRTEPTPSGGAGYDFGASADKVHAKCRADGGVFKHTHDVSSCTKRHDKAGATQVTLVEYCSSKVCRVHSVAVLDEPDAKSWLTAFEALQRGLQKSFGNPDDRKIDVPKECETRFAECVKSGKASAMLSWHWDDGSAVMLRLGATKNTPAGLSVSYANAAGGLNEPAK